MMMDLGLDRFRLSLLCAMGLLAACGPQTGSTDTNQGTESSSESGVVATACEGATPIMQVNAEGVETGWLLCASGAIHRDAAVECVDPTPGGAACPYEGMACESDADCDAGPFGRCVDTSFFDQSCGCVYGCERDADCSGNTVCACGGDAGEGNAYPSAARCIPTTCTLSADCDAQMCAMSSLQDGCGANYQAACTTPQDACQADADCDVDCHPEGPGGAWECVDYCCCGRPFIVEGRARVASLRARVDWGASIEDVSEDLSDESRARAAEHWRGAALMEHASIPSFARFSLQLLAGGAPPELLVEACRATRDEIVHARRCFAHAARYADAPALGPGALDVHGRGANELEATLTAVVHEACVGETLAAIEAAAARDRAREAAVVRTLEVIAADELRHAQLGWRTLRWALAEQPSARVVIARAFAAALSEARASLSAAPRRPVDANAEGHGVLDDATRRELLARALQEVVLPCARALLGEGVADARARARV